MSSYTRLYVRGAEVFSWRNSIDPTFFFLYTKDDVRHVHIEPDEVWDESTSIHLTSSASVLADRLDALGTGKRRLSRNSISVSATGWKASKALAMSWHSRLTNSSPRLNCLRLSRFRTGLICSLPRLRPSSIFYWRQTGKLGPAPWSLKELLAVKHRADARYRRRGVTTAHGSLSRVEAGCNCPDCRAAAAAFQRERERRQAETQFPPSARAELLELLGQGVPFKQAFIQIGVRAHQVWGRARSDPAWGAPVASHNRPREAGRHQSWPTIGL